MGAWLVARGNGKGVSLERHGERAGGSEVFRQEKANREGRVQVVVGSSGTSAPVTGAPVQSAGRVRTRLPDKSIRQRGEEMQMAGPVGAASSSDQTARGVEPVPETPLKCFPAGRRCAWRKRGA